MLPYQVDHSRPYRVRGGGGVRGGYGGGASGGSRYATDILFNRSTVTASLKDINNNTLVTSGQQGGGGKECIDPIIYTEQLIQDIKNALREQMVSCEVYK